MIAAEVGATILINAAKAHVSEIYGLIHMIGCLYPLKSTCSDYGVMLYFTHTSSSLLIQLSSDLLIAASIALIIDLYFEMISS